MPKYQEVLLAVSKKKAKIRSEDCVQGEEQLSTLPLTLSWRRPLSYRNQSVDWFLYDIGLRHERVKMEGLRNIGHSMNLVLDTKKSNFRNQKCLRFYISFIMTLYYKMRPLFYYKMRERFITKYVSCFITICDSSIRKCGSY